MVLCQCFAAAGSHGDASKMSFVLSSAKVSLYVVESVTNYGRPWVVEVNLQPQTRL